jgi:putative membrane protein
MNSTLITTSLKAAPAIVLTALAMTIPAIAQAQGTMQTPATSPASATTRPAVSEQDANFLKSAHPLAEASLAAARLAIVKAEAEPVRKLGRDIIADQTTANEELKRLALQHGVSLPQGVPAERKKALDQLARASGVAFDREYLRQQKDDSSATLRLFQEQVRSGTGQFKVYAEATLPRLQEHNKFLSGQ